MGWNNSCSKKKYGNARNILAISLLLLIISLACNAPVFNFRAADSSENQVSPNQVNIAIAKSLTARAPVDGSEDDIGGDQDAMVEDDSSLESTATPTPSITPTPTISLTPTPDKAVAYISENTNCRFGPGEVYDLIHTFMAGDWVDLTGKDEKEFYWYVQDQESGFTTCWLWGKYATPEGDTANLPVFTPPPTPTPVVDFTIKYKETICAGKEIIVKVTNTGDLTIESYKITLKDKSTSETTAKTANQFNGSVAKVAVGKSGEITGKAFSASTIGHKIVATIKACSDDNKKGYCVTRTVEFKSK